MFDSAIVPHHGQPLMPDLRSMPTLFLDAGDHACRKVIEFFTATIRNPNTRRNYAGAVAQFAEWCARHELRLEQLNPFLIASYIEEVGQHFAKPTVKLHLAAIRMLFDFLVTGQVVPMNPASSVRGPKYVIKKGKTPVLTAEETRQLLDAIDLHTIAGLRDRALIGVMVFSFARVGAVIGMNVDDYYQQGKRWWIRLHEKGGKHHEVPVHHRLEEYLDAYLTTAEIGLQKGSPLFRTLDRRRQLTADRIERREVLAMVKRRARRADLGDGICCHTFRATGITAYLRNGGTIERAASIANHESTRTTQLYNRTDDDISLDEIERILI